MKLLALLALTGVAAAQPGAVAPQLTYQRLTPEEEDMLDRGEITGEQRASGTMFGFLLGFGIGQAVQGRWHSRGWKFAIAEVLTLGLFIGGEIHDRGKPQGDVGISGWGGLGAFAWMSVRLWQGFDALIAPSSYNDHIKTLRVRAGYSFYVAPHDNGAVAGLGLSF